MFKLSLALSAVSFVAGLADLAEYCTQLVSQCGTVHDSIKDVTVCNSVMNTTTPGEITDGDVDTIGCRFKYLNNSAFKSTESCRYAGPSGGGRCGSVIDNVCRISTNVCMGAPDAAYMTTADCKAALAPLTTQWGSKQGDAAASDNSLECRVYHAIASLNAPTAGHCSHWNFTSTQCKNDIVPDATHYCELLDFNCNTTGTLQFTDKAQCLAVAANYVNVPAFVAAGNAANSLGCRIYHAIAAKEVNKGHCGHAGPTGGNFCGTTREAWTTMLARAPCMDTTVQQAATLLVSSANIDAAYPTGFQAETTTQASYTATLDQAGGTQACRFYHLSVAATSATAATTHCPHGNVMGGGACGTIEGNLCQVIKTACSFGTNTWQFATMDACTTALKNSTAYPIALGDQTSTSGNNYACRFYHAAVAASYLPDGKNYNASTAAERTTNIQTHCGHVLKMPKEGCAGTQKPSSASSLSALMALVVAVVSVFSM